MPAVTIRTTERVSYLMDLYHLFDRMPGFEAPEKAAMFCRRELVPLRILRELRFQFLQTAMPYYRRYWPNCDHYTWNVLPRLQAAMAENAPRCDIDDEMEFDGGYSDHPHLSVVVGFSRSDVLHMFTAPKVFGEEYGPEDIAPAAPMSDEQADTAIRELFTEFWEAVPFVLKEHASDSF